MASLLTLSDVMCTGHHAPVNAGVKKGDTVAVVGDGAVGLCADKYSIFIADALEALNLITVMVAFFTFMIDAWQYVCGSDGLYFYIEFWGIGIQCNGLSP